jgi:RNA polymerase sigma-70 factor (ECF subfamily)
MDLWTKYYRSVKKYIENQVGDEMLAEELATDTIKAAIDAWPSFNHKSSEFSWICAIGKHKIIDYWRKKRLKTVLFSVSPKFEDIADKALGPEGETLKDEIREEIEKVWKELKEESRKILRLKYIDGQKSSQVAKILNISLKATESRIVRARKQFASLWKYDQRKNKKTEQTIVDRNCPTGISAGEKCVQTVVSTVLNDKRA